MNRSSLLAAATAAAALAAFPAVASAAPTAAVNGTTITVTGNANDNEDIVIAETGGLISVDGNTNLGGNTAAANGTFSLNLNAGGGNDTLTVNTTNLAASTINGGDGNDVLNGTAADDVMTGGPGDDTLNGADGNDRIIGNQGSDDFLGGNGNDEMIWNPGDGNDDMDGEGGGGDDAVFNGGDNSEAFSITPNAGRVNFDRITGPINLDVGPTTDRLVLNGNGGNDSLASDQAVTTPMLLNGGVGNDAYTAGGGNDLLNGNDGNDVLNGANGIDRIVGDRGGDTMLGGTGDDTTVWNNGDGSDVMEGQDGLDKVEVNGAGTGDAFTIVPNGARARFDRTNLVPFNLDIGGGEVLDVNGLGGDDTFVASAGTPLAVVAEGGSGNDILTGADEQDTFLGGTGNDTLTGGAGPDLLDGQDGDDSLLARDNTGDLVRGGIGTDSAQADLASIDAVDGVETIDRPATTPAPGDETATPVRILGKQFAVRRNGRRSTTRIRMLCPATETGGCSGRITLLSQKTFRVAGVKVRVQLGSARFDLDPGQAKRVTVRLPRGVRALARNKKIGVIAGTTTRDAAGNVAEASSRLTLKL